MCPALKTAMSDNNDLARTGWSVGVAGIQTALIIVGIASVLWLPLALATDFLILPVVREMLETNALFMSEARYRIILALAGVKGFVVLGAVIAAAVTLLRRTGRAVQICLSLLICLVSGIVLAAVFLPPDLIAQLVWIACGLCAAGIAAGIDARRHKQ